MKVKVKKYKNGLTLLYLKHRINNSTSVLCNINTGGLDAKAGLTHFAEHMFFADTVHFTKQELAEEIRKVAYVDAYTTINKFAIHYTRTSKLLDKSLGLLSEMLLNCHLTTKNVESERNVILEEIRRYQDDTDENIDKIICKNIYGIDINSQLIGSIEEVENISIEDIQDFITSNVVSNNTVISVCSNVSFTKVQRLINKHFVEKMHSDAKLQPRPYQRHDLLPKGSIIKTESPINQLVLSITYGKYYPFDIHKIPTFIYLFNYLRPILHEKLRKDGLIYSMKLDHSRLVSSSEISINIRTSQGKDEQCLQIIKDVITDLVNNGISGKDFEVIKNNHKYKNDEFGITKPLTRSNEAYNSYMQNIPFNINKKYKKIFKKLKFTDVQNLAKEYFVDAEIFVSVIGTKEALALSLSTRRIKNLVTIKPRSN